MNAQTIMNYDKDGYVVFGKHSGTKFEGVPKDYLNWVYYNVDHGTLQRLYPNFWKYLCSHYKEFTEDNII